MRKTHMLHELPYRENRIYHLRRSDLHFVSLKELPRAKGPTTHNETGTGELQSGTFQFLRSWLLRLGAILMAS